MAFDARYLSLRMCMYCVKLHLELHFRSNLIQLKHVIRAFCFILIVLHFLCIRRMTFRVDMHFRFGFIYDSTSK